MRNTNIYILKEKKINLNNYFKSLFICTCVRLYLCVNILLIWHLNGIFVFNMNGN